jgi:hypothetical protein
MVAPRLGRVHEDVVGDHQVKQPVLAGGELRAGVHPEVDAGVVRLRDVEYPHGDVHAGNKGAAVAELPRQVARPAAGVGHGEPADVAGEFPQDGIGVQPPVAVTVVADLDTPVVGKKVPALAGFLEGGRRSSVFLPTGRL